MRHSAARGFDGLLLLWGHGVHRRDTATDVFHPAAVAFSVRAAKRAVAMWRASPRPSPATTPRKPNPSDGTRLHTRLAAIGRTGAPAIDAACVAATANRVLPRWSEHRSTSQMRAEAQRQSALHQLRLGPSGPCRSPDAQCSREHQARTSGGIARAVVAAGVLIALTSAVHLFYSRSPRRFDGERMDESTLTWIVAAELTTGLGGLGLLAMRKPSERLLEGLLGLRPCR